MLVEGKRLIIEGGRVHFQGNVFICNSCGYTFTWELARHIEACPRCQSPSLVDMAGRFGHGRCCHGRHNRNFNRRR